MRQQQKQWEALGWSRASWYRHGKPDYAYRRQATQKDEAAKGRMSLRTYQRFCRIVQYAPELIPFLEWALRQRFIRSLEQMIKDPAMKKRFLEWAEEQRAKAKETEPPR